jgi:hypothetical protein
LVYIRVNWTDARQVLDPIKAAPEAALQKLRGLWLIQPRGYRCLSRHLKSSNTLVFAGSLGLMSLHVLSPNRLRTSNDRL